MSNKPNFIIVHGCPSVKEKYLDEKKRAYDKHWMPWIKEKLIQKGYQVETPLMPEPWYPDYEKFKKEFEKYKINKDSVLIGHSCGCAFLVKWLGESKKEIKKLVLVAPWKINETDDIYRENFYNFKIDTSISDRVEEIIMFTSDNEELAGKESLKTFHEALGGKIIDLPNRGHYTKNDMRTEEFPELLKIAIN